MKKVLGFCALMFGVFTLAACGNGLGGKEKLVVWSFTDEIKTMVNDYYLIDNPDLPYEIEIVMTPTEQYQSRLDGALQTGKNAPDVILLEQQYAKKYLESDYLMSLDSDGLDLADRARENNYLYTVEYMEKDGTNYGLSWQAAPGAFYYRRSIAESVLGTSDPVEVQSKISNWDDFKTLAVDLAKADYRILSNMTGVSKPMLAGRDTPWFIDNKLDIAPEVYEYLDMLYYLENTEEIEGINHPLSNESTAWADAWFSDMYGDKVFGYFLPSWGLHYVLKPNSESSDGKFSSYGDWGVIEGPQAYFEGGTWITVREGSKMTEEAKHLIEYITLNNDFMKQWALDTGDFVGSISVIEEIKSSVSDDFLAGQNQYEVFDALAKNIKNQNVTGFDMDILSILDSSSISYATQTNDMNTPEDVIESFKTAIKNAFQQIDVE